MRYEILKSGTVVNTIVADPVFVEANYAGRYRKTEESAPVVIRPPITVLAFRNRFTQAEKEAIYTAAQSVIAIKVWIDDLAAAQEVDLSFPLTIAGVKELEGSKLIAAGRANEILSGD